MAEEELVDFVVLSFLKPTAARRMEKRYIHRDPQ